MSIFNFAAPHIVLHAEKMFDFLGVSITNSVLLGWITSAFLVFIFIWGAKHINVNSGNRRVSIIELLCDLVLSLAGDTMHDRKKADRYAPFLLTVFVFIIFNNWFGLLPGVGAITYGGQPLFRAWTADLTGTLALSISSIIIIQIYAVRELKVGGYLKHYFSAQPWNPINFFVGLLEVLGEFTRMASLSLRLFGNIFAGEVLLVVLSSITSYGSPVATMPFIVMELFVGFIQAFVFTMLIIVYLTLATADHSDSTAHHDEGHNQDHSSVGNTEHEPLLQSGSPNV